MQQNVAIKEVTTSPKIDLSVREATGKCTIGLVQAIQLLPSKIYQNWKYDKKI